jgi:protein-tyrosine phosphatase
MLVDGKNDFKSDYKEGIYCRNLSKDLGWFVDNIKADQSNPFLETVPYRKVVAEILNIMLFRERNDTLVIDDFGPAVAEINAIFSKIYLKINRIVCSNHLVRMLQKKKAIKQVKQSRKILFVCKGNICRSPFAHYYLKSILSSVFTVESCGYFPKDGRPCPAEAIIAGKKFGIDLDLHRSVLISDEIIQNADIIFTFDEQNMKTVIGRFSYEKSKIVRISSLDPFSSLEILDPYSHDVDYFCKIYQQIKQLVDGLENI